MPLSFLSANIDIVFKSLKSCHTEGGDNLLPVVPEGQTRTSGLKQQGRRYWLDMNKNFLNVSTVWHWNSLPHVLFLSLEIFKQGLMNMSQGWYSCLHRTEVWTRQPPFQLYGRSLPILWVLQMGLVNIQNQVNGWDWRWGLLGCSCCLPGVCSSTWLTVCVGLQFFSYLCLLWQSSARRQELSPGCLSNAGMYFCSSHTPLWWFYYQWPR